MSEAVHDVVVVGGGPAGYTAALRCAEHGLRVVLVERGAIGGTCLNVGCIPSKALIHAAESYEALSGSSLGAMGVQVGDRTIDLAATMRWKDGIVDRLRQGVVGFLERGVVDLVVGHAELIDPRTVRVATPSGERMLTGRNLVLATGSEPVELAQLPFGGTVLSSTEALALTSVPERLVVVGAGYIGLELGTALAKLGSTVTLVEVADRVLPLFDGKLTRPVTRRLEELGVTLRLQTKALGLDDTGVTVEGPNGERDVVAADAVLVTVGRRPVTEGLGLERLGLPVDGPLPVDDRCRTTVASVYAVGDLTGEPMLAHRGIAQGELVADVIAGHDRSWDHLAIPAVCFTDPEVFSVGRSPEEARRTGGEVAVGTASFRANGRALTLDDDAGFVRVVVDVANGVVVGVQGVGAGAAELAAPAALAVEMSATAEDLRSTAIAHPTLSEALGDAVRALPRSA